ncbi:borealin-2 isoform X1 [Cynoglossus semilaevis]|uniref:Borealin-2-like n=1 Tax=Cynoglossus semilaevis TaxID=244447 RepID=A0A3P8VJ23_CYNSE|nr:borealin-2-like isoform X1 [Cynoglossus semilaevis]
MPLRRRKNAGNKQNNEQQSREMRQSRLAPFIQQFQKEAQERMNELEARMENMLSTVDKIFKVEKMKMPPSLQKTLIGDLISEEEISASEVSIAMKNESIQISQPLKRVSSRKAVKSTESPPVQSMPGQRSSNRTTKTSNGTKRTRTLPASISTGSLRASTVIAKRTQSRLTKTVEHTPQNKPKLRSVVSTGDLHCSVAGSAAHITVTTAQGQSVSFSEESKDEINLDLLDDVAWCQIQRLTSLMEYLSKQSRCIR